MDPSRRIHGRHPALPRGGAAADADGVDPETAQGWLARARELAQRHDLPEPVLVVRGDHVTLAQPCPPDLRDLAADLLDRATGEADGEVEPRPDLALRGWLAAADAAELPAFFDDDHLTIGFGSAALRLDRGSLPPPSTTGIGRIPIVVVTGTNGKTTTATLLAAIAAAAGHVVGVATSTGVRVGADLVETGDWSGPGAARLVGDDPRVTFAVLETARGGLLRRGLLVSHVDVAVLTNVSADHLGEWGIDTLPALAEVKRVVAEAVRAGGTVVSNADDPVLDEAVRSWIGSRPDLTWVRFRGADDPLPLPVADIPLTLGGAARYNRDNAVAAAAAARALGIGDAAIARGLRAVRPDPRDNPGRTNLWRLGGAQILVDYAHNPDGLRRLRELCDGLAPRRRWMVLGQAGDRPDGLVQALAAEAAAIGCAGYALKPLPGYARGREPAEVVEVLYRGLIDAGVDPARIERVTDELAAVGWIADRVGPGDLGLLLVHEDLDAAVAALRARGAEPWSP